MPLLDHFAKQIHAHPALPGNKVVLATIAEMERAVRDPACSEISVQAEGLGYIPVSKATVREKLSMLRQTKTARILAATVTSSDDGTATITFDKASLTAARIYAPEVLVGDAPPERG